MPFKDSHPGLLCDDTKEPLSLQTFNMQEFWKLNMLVLLEQIIDF